uniref:Uncharacterized protein n=1 Tax=Ditylenchus dipsaci TaxID=166011 RepID=A0A915EQM3_9BILA
MKAELKQNELSNKDSANRRASDQRSLELANRREENRLRYDVGTIKLMNDRIGSVSAKHFYEELAHQFPE